MKRMFSSAARKRLGITPKRDGVQTSIITCWAHPISMYPTNTATVDGASIG